MPTQNIDHCVCVLGWGGVGGGGEGTGPPSVEAGHCIRKKFY